MSGHRKAPRDWGALLERIREEGGEISIRRNGHLVAVAPNGRKVYMSQSPSDTRAAARAWSVWRRVSHGG